MGAGTVLPSGTGAVLPSSRTRATRAVGTGDLLAYCAAMAPLDPTDLLDLYWAGRATLVSRKDDIDVYDQVFRAGLALLVAVGEPLLPLHR